MGSDRRCSRRRSRTRPVATDAQPVHRDGPARPSVRTTATAPQWSAPTSTFTSSRPLARTAFPQPPRATVPPRRGMRQGVANRSDRGEHERCRGRVRRGDEGPPCLGAVGASRFGVGRGGNHGRRPRSARTRTATSGLLRDPAASECRRDNADVVRSVLRPVTFLGAAAVAVLGPRREVEETPGVFAVRCPAAFAGGPVQLCVEATGAQ